MDSVYIDEYKNELGRILVETLMDSFCETEELINYTNKLLDEGANINYKDYETGNTAIMIAVLKGYPNIFDNLLSRKPDLESKNSFGISVIHFAASNKSDYYLNSLCERKTDVNIPDKVGNRPINYAIKSGAIHNILILFQNNCTRNFLNSFGLSIYDEAIFTGNDEIVDCVFNKHKKKENKIKKVINKVLGNKKYSK